MKDLSVSQSYLICALNENGKFPALSTESPICVLAGALIDLIFFKSVGIGADKKLCITGELNEDNQYLKSLYTFIKESKPMKIDGLAHQYTFTFSDKRLKSLINDVGTSLSVLGYATTENGGLFGKTPCFIPDTKIVNNVIENIRAELLETGTVSDNMIALVSLMNKSNQVKQYFSKHEKDQLKSRLKQIKDSDANKLISEILDYITTMIVITTAH